MNEDRRLSASPVRDKPSTTMFDGHPSVEHRVEGTSGEHVQP